MTVYFTKEQPKLTEAVYLRMNETQKKTIAREAKLARLKPSEWMRMKLFNEHPHQH